MALFDADGVLWSGDVSEDFTRWMIARGEFDPQLWQEYQDLNQADPAAGCFFILKFYCGMPLARLQDRVQEFWRTAGPRSWLRRPVAVLNWLHSIGYQILVVSGTPAPVLAPLTSFLPVDEVLALQLQWENGHATGEHLGIPTVGQGKADRVLATTKHHIALAMGNSALDIPMLKLSQGLRWAVNPDQQLLALAEQQDWLISHE